MASPRFHGKLLRILVLFLIAALLIPLLTGAQPALAAGSYDAVWGDGFDDAKFNSLWTLQNPDPTHWRFSADAGRFFGFSNALEITTSPLPLKNILSMDAPTSYYKASAYMFFQPNTPGQFAGMRVYQDDQNYAEVVWGYTTQPVIEWNVMRGGTLTISNVMLNDPFWGGMPIYLTITRQGNTYIGGILTQSGLSQSIGYAAFPAPLGLIQIVSGNRVTDAPEIPGYFGRVDLQFASPYYTHAVTDRFDRQVLSGVWSWLNGTQTGWTLQSGYLTINTPVQETHANVLLRDLPSGDFDVRTYLSFQPSANIQEAGLILYANDDNYLLLSKKYCNLINECAGAGLGYFFDYIKAGQSVDPQTPYSFYAWNMDQRDAWIRLIREGNTYAAYLQMSGDWSWNLIARRNLDASFKPVRVGLKTASLLEAPSIPARFDEFYMASSNWIGNMAFMPLLIRDGDPYAPTPDTPTPTVEEPTPQPPMPLP